MNLIFLSFSGVLAKSYLYDMIFQKNNFIAVKYFLQIFPFSSILSY